MSFSQKSIVTDHQKDYKAIVPEIEKNLDFDFNGIKCGVAQYEEGPTGTTVILFEDENGKPKNMKFYADRRGGAVGAIYDDFGIANGFCFSGGSLYGHEAVYGVMQYFHEKTDYSNDWMAIPDIPGAIIFDFGPRNNGIYPDKRLGYIAAKNATGGQIPIGRYGAGRMSTAGKGFQYQNGQFSGQGAAFRQIGDVKILVLTILNPMGALKDRDGKTVLGHWNYQTSERLDLLETLRNSLDLEKPKESSPTSQNTTLTLVITNHQFDSYFLKQISRQLHSSMAKMIYPFHTSSDGDILFFASTSELDGKLDDVKFSMIASEVLWDAVLSVI